MPPPVSTAARRLPAALLLGLLALLLWGQCAPSRDSDKATPPGVYISVEQADSLSAPADGRPAVLYLTLFVSNALLQQACQLRGFEGALQFGNHRWPLAGQHRTDTLSLPSYSQRLVPVQVPLPLPPDSLAALRRVLRQGSSYENSLRLRLHVSYSIPGSPGQQLATDTVSFVPALAAPLRQPQPGAR